MYLNYSWFLNVISKKRYLCHTKSFSHSSLKSFFLVEKDLRLSTSQAHYKKTTKYFRKRWISHDERQINVDMWKPNKALLEECHPIPTVIISYISSDKALISGILILNRVELQRHNLETQSHLSTGTTRGYARD